MIEKWRVLYNTKRPQSAVGYRPPAPAACSPRADQSPNCPYSSAPYLKSVLYTQ